MVFLLLKPSVNASSHDAYETKPMSNAAEASPSIPNTGITPEQYLHLVSLLQQSSLAPSANSNHITSHPAIHSQQDISSDINTIFSNSLNV